MSNPLLVESVRGTRVESAHRGAFALVDAAGSIVASAGDIERPIFPRSAVKALQALPLLESGAAERFGLNDEALALACASHSGEPAHVAGVERMLASAALDPSALECGAHWPLHQASGQALARSGRVATALHNNCSGKHAGFLCTACALGAAPRGYTQAHHPVQREVKAVLESLTGTVLTPENCAIDGCSVPTWAIPLRNLAHAFARFGSGRDLDPARARAARRLREACAAHPWHAAGTGRFCTEIMRKLGRRVYVKTGAEGVFCAALPETGLGIAVKCDDGTTRAAEVTTAALIARFGGLDAGDCAAIEPHIRPTLRNWNGIAVGMLRPAGALNSG